MFSQIYKMIQKHGLTSTYRVITEGAYDIDTSSTINTETNYSVKVYRKHIRANQFNFPNLVGKDSALFYIVNLDLTFIPTSGDYIVYDSETYKIDSVQKHTALGAVELYRIVGVK